MHMAVHDAFAYTWPLHSTGTLTFMYTCYAYATHTYYYTHRNVKLMFAMGLYVDVYT